MKALAALAGVICLACSPASAGSFGIDWSPLHSPTFGKRPDYNTGTNLRGLSSDTAPAREELPEKSEDMTAVGNALTDNGARLAQEVIDIPAVRLPSGDAEMGSVTAIVGTKLLAVGSETSETLWAPLSSSPPITVPSESLPLATALTHGATQGGISLEDAAFLAQQAANALEGAPMQVVIDRPEANSDDDNRAELLTGALGDAAAALDRYDRSLQGYAVFIKEAESAPPPWGPEGQEFRDHFYQAKEAVENAEAELTTAKKAVSTILLGQ